jgi:hypothetical protein
MAIDEAPQLGHRAAGIVEPPVVKVPVPRVLGAAQVFLCGRHDALQYAARDPDQEPVYRPEDADELDRARRDAGESQGDRGHGAEEQEGPAVIRRKRSGSSEEPWKEGSRKM